MKAWKKLLICGSSFVIAFLLNVAIDLACGGEMDPYDYYTSFFHNNLQGEKEYGAFYLTWDQLFSQDEPESQDKINANEWGAYLKMPLDTGLKKNPKFKAALALPENKPAKAYWTFALKAEPLANMNDADRWDPKPHDTTKVINAAQEAYNLAQKEIDGFFKLRYYYQAQRLYHYSKLYKEAADVYDKHIASFDSKSHVKGWALACRAGEARWLGDTVKAAYLFSKVFAQYPERRIQAYKNYHYMSNVPVESVLAMAANNNERSQIYALEAFGNPEFALNELEQVYALNPASAMVGSLLVREINKLEADFLTPILNRRTQGLNYLDRWDNGSNSNDAKSLEKIKALKAFCLKLAQQKKYSQPSLGYMAAAYLDWMVGKPVDGLKTLTSIDKAALDKKLGDATQFINLLLIAQNISNLNSQTEADLQPLLAWLERRVRAEKAEVKPRQEHFYLTRFANSSRDFYNQVLGPAYLKQRDTVKAAMCLLKGQTSFFYQNYLRSVHVEQLLNMRLHTPAQPYLKVLAGGLQNLPLNDWYDLLGTTYLREHNYAKAVAALKHIPAAVATKSVSYEGANPFQIQLADYPKNFGKQKFTKLMFAQTMLELQNKAKANPATAGDSYYRMAVGLYNASTYGNAYYLLSYSWSAYDYGRKPVFSYDADYIQTRTAERYFLLARQNFKASAELSAKCTFMAAKCRQKQYLLPDYNTLWKRAKNMDPADRAYANNIRNNPYFAELNRVYAKTNLYKTAVNECSYLRDFLRRQAPVGKKVLVRK